MNIHIVSDTSCDLFDDEILTTVPFAIDVGGQEFIDDASLDTSVLVDAMEKCESAGKTSCPTVDAWEQAFSKDGNIIALTISSNVSGSFNSANSAKNIILEKDSNKKIHVINSKTSGPALAICIERIKALIKSNLSFEEIVKKADETMESLKTVYALCSFDNLVKNGRMNKLVGFVAKKLGMWGIGIASKEGTIQIIGKVRGEIAAVSQIIKDLEERNFAGNTLYISHCHNLLMVERIKNAIKEKWQDTKIEILNTRGLDSFYAERKGIIIAYE